MTTVNLSNRKEAIELANRYMELKAQEKAMKVESDKILEKLQRMSGGVDADVGAFKLTCVTRQGSIRYAEAVKELLPDMDLEKFRGKPSTFWRLS